MRKEIAKAERLIARIARNQHGVTPRPAPALSRRPEQNEYVGRYLTARGFTPMRFADTELDESPLAIVEALRTALCFAA